MTEQRKMELVRAFARGETPEQAAEGEGVGVPEALEVRLTCAEEIAEAQEALKGAENSDV